MKIELTKLPYSTDALEPHISAKTLEIHHGKHHKGYVDKLKSEIEGTDAADLSLLEMIRTRKGKVFNFAAQIWNHSFYWDCLSPKGGGGPAGALLKAVDRDLGGVDGFRESFSEAAAGEFGSGWAWLICKNDGSLAVMSSSDADTPVRQGHTPLLTLDVWEHAYYLDFQNERGKYIEAYLDHLVNWKFAEENFQSVANK